MTNDFESVAQFLEKFGYDVEGHALDEMPADVKSKLRDFARGNLNAAQRGELARLLQANPKWVGLLAQEARSTGQA
jgi:hypothetical protein